MEAAMAAAVRQQGSWWRLVPDVIKLHVRSLMHSATAASPVEHALSALQGYNKSAAVHMIW